MAHSAAAAVAVHSNDDGRLLQDPMHEVDLGRPFKCAGDGSAHDERPPPHGEYPEWWAYQRDVLERTILFWDVLRQRANNMLEHERRGMPPLLDFKYETVLDARQFEPAANYALLRITEVETHCWDDCVDVAKPPVIVVDPRAGHGPGIGGFKRASEVGMAMREGHPVYFVVFYPEPEPAQSLFDVLRALRRFVAEVAHRHPGKAPVLYGNCQAGWAVTLLSADCQGLVGPAVLNGSPLSYWAGEAGVNPMRLAGGLLGGAWLAHFAADLGDGRFDGAWLAQNFENLKPEKAIWEKYTSLFHRVDEEQERFLDFERWWNGFYFLSREEMLALVENLFIGNKLERGLMRICEDCLVDLKRIRNPLVIFASYGDNITPPHQALGWVHTVYRSTADLKKAGQRIVYLINPHVGHLGIFVSAAVARLEHRAILDNIDEIEALPPGLYEMKIGNPDLGIDGLRSRADINSDEQMDYLSQAGQWRVSQPSGGYDPERYQMSWGVDPEAVPHISVDNLPKLYTSQDYMTRQQGFQQSMQQAGFEDQMQSGPETFYLQPEMQGAPVEVLDRLTQSNNMKDILFRQQLLGGALEDKVREAMAIYQQIQQQQQQQQQGGMGSY